MSSLKVLSLSRRPCIGKLNSLLAGANFLDHYPIHKNRSVQGLGLPSPPRATRSITCGGWSCTSFKGPNQAAKSGTDPASGSGTKSGAEPCGSPTPGEAAGQENEQKRRCRRTRQRDEAFRAKLGFALFRQGGVNLWKKARKEAKNFEFEETKRMVQAGVEQSKVKVKEFRENIFTIPNLLTTTRLALAPYLGYLVINEQYLLGSSLFALAGVTDLLDGWIARNFKNQQSVLGSILDPLADKCLISILTITLTYSDLIPVPLTALIIVRDVGLMSAAFYLRYQSLPPPVTLRRYFDVTHATVQMKPTFISKVNTAVQLCLVGFTILAPVLNYTDHPYLHGLWYVTAATTVLSGLSYCFKRDVFKYLTKGR